MDSHPLVDQLRFARSEFVRCLEGVSEQDARHRFEPMNSISWIVGHLASQEHTYWVLWAQGENLAPDLHKLVGWGRPPSTPPIEEMWAIWRDVNSAADGFLDTLTPAQLTTHLEWRDKPVQESIGTLLRRNTYHYFFHIGEAHAIRQMSDHPDLPQFVGDMSPALYRPES